MNINKIKNLFIEIKSLAKFNYPRTKDRRRHTYGLYDTISFLDKEIDIFEEIINCIMEDDKVLFGSIDKAFLENKIKDIILNSYINKSEINENNISDFQKDMSSKQVKLWEVFRPIFGIDLNVPKPVFLGRYNIYHLVNHFKTISNNYNKLNLDLNLFHFGEIETAISVKIDCRTPERAIEISDEYFEIFENIVNYMIGDLSYTHEVGILNFSGKNWKFAKALSETDNSDSIGSTNFENTDLSDSYFMDKTLGNDKIWEIVSKSYKDRNILEKRLLTSIEWIGKAIRDKDKSKSFIQFIFSIEAIMLLQESTILTPSIGYQLKESISLILGSDRTERIEIDSTINELYKKRSAIVHGGTKNLDSKDLGKAMKICKSLIIKLLTDDTFNKFQNVKQLHEWVKEQKYK